MSTQVVFHVTKKSFTTFVGILAALTGAFTMGGCLTFGFYFYYLDISIIFVPLIIITAGFGGIMLASGLYFIIIQVFTNIELENIVFKQDLITEE